jgi:hypothetical protein
MEGSWGKTSTVRAGTHRVARRSTYTYRRHISRGRRDVGRQGHGRVGNGITCAVDSGP